MKNKSFVTGLLILFLNVAYGQQTLSATIEKKDIYESSSLGSAKVTIAGGKAPYYVLWSSGSTSKNITGLKSGSYLLRISDATGTYIEKKVVIEDKTAVLLSASPN